jgi:D-alanyl-D-alanine carboxypeptidase
MTDLTRIWTELGIPADYAVTRGLPLQPEAAELVSIGADNQNRECRLAPGAAQAWRAMRDAALADGIKLLPVSGFRSVERQAELIRHKLARGDRLDDILRSNAAPGYSEHHTGRALDITDGVTPPLDEAFESTAAFAWLARHAERFCYHPSYPRNNAHGFVYEPWHWCWLARTEATGIEQRVAGGA